jgi:glycosyltransferase involved in cell wall biosynthesis
MWNISVIVTTHNRSGHLRKCVASLEAQTVRPHEVVVADDGSDPEHVRVIEQLIERSPLTIIHARQEHDGYRVAASRNNGVRHSTGDYLFFTDGDVVFFPDVLEGHVAVPGRRRWVTGHAVRLMLEETERVTEELIRSGRLQEAWPGLDDPRCAGLPRLAGRFRRRARRARRWPSERRLRRLELIGTQASVPRAAFERVNGFDESFRGWGDEDLDLGLRLQLAGLRACAVVDTCRALHQYHETLATTSQNGDYYNRPRWRRCRCKNGLCTRAR